jgi:hypothetical protein
MPSKGVSAMFVNTAQEALGAGGRFWLFGGPALLDAPGTSMATLDLPGVPNIYEGHRANWNAVKATSPDHSSGSLKGAGGHSARR